MDWVKIVVPSFLTALLGYVAAWVTHRQTHKQKIAELELKAKLADETSKKKEELADEKINKKDRLSFYQLMAVNLKASHSAFIDQCRLRNRLLRLLGYDPKTFNWEKLEDTFASAYENLNAEQRALFDFMRGITEDTLFPRNDEMLELLKKKSEYFHELPEFEALQDHLQLWLAKFKAIFKKRQDRCLVYVGVKERKPFPVDIGKKVSQAIEKMNEDTESSPGEKQQNTRRGLGFR